MNQEYLPTNLPPDEQKISETDFLEPVLTPAEELGLVDGQFRVPRGKKSADGYERVDDGGWTIAAHKEVMDPDTNKEVTAVFLMKPSPIKADSDNSVEGDPDNVMTKSIRLSDLLEVQYPDVNPGVSDSALHQVTDPESKPAQIDIAMAELREGWGLPEDTYTSDAIQKIDIEADRINGMLTLLVGFDAIREVAGRQLQASLNDGKMALFGSNRRAIDSLVHDKYFSELLKVSNNEETAFLPAAIKNKLKDLGRSLTNLRYGYEEMNRRGPNWIDPEGAIKVKQSLRQLPEVTRQLYLARQQLEDMKINIKGYSGDQEIVDSKEVEYRNGQVLEWKKALENDSLPPEELEAITRQIEISIAREAETVVPGSPGSWFGARIIDNSDSVSKNRHAASSELGREKGGTKSQRIVAEMVVDMLRGQFDISRAKGDVIMQSDSQKGNIEYGVHRAAALAMIYGQKWQEAGLKLGHDIQKR